MSLRNPSANSFAAVLASVVVLLIGAFATSASLRADLIVYYDFDVDQSGGATVANQANPGTYDGVLQADAQTTGGKLVLDGSDAFLQTALRTADLGSTVTMAFRINPETIAKRPVISGYKSGNTNRWDVQLSRNDDGNIGFIEHQGSNWVPSTTVLATGTEYHVAIVYDKGGSGNAYVYVDGVEENSKPLNYALDTGIDVMIGYGDPYAYLHGSLDDVAIWNNQALTACQIEAIAARRTVSTDDGDWGDVGTLFGPTGSGADVLIAGGNTVTVSSGTAQADQLQIGCATESGTLDYDGGSLAINNITVGPSGTLNCNLATWTYEEELAVDGGTVDAASNTVVFDNGADVTVGGASASIVAGDLRVGNTGATQSTFAQSGGLVDVAGVTNVGTLAGSNGVLGLSGDAHYQTNELDVGNYGAGRAEIGDDAHLEVTTGGTRFRIGVHADGTVVQTGGTVSQPGGGAMYLGVYSGATGRYEISGGTLDQGSLSIGGYSGDTGMGIVTQTGGQVIAHRDVRMGRGTGGYGEYNLSNGTLTVLNDGSGGDGSLIVGRDGNATAKFNQTGGLVETVGDLLLGRGADNQGAYDISGGTLTVGGSLLVGNNDGNGTGRLRIVGDAATIETSGYAQNANSTLELDIDGGISPINVEGDVSLAGLLDVEFLLSPLVGEQFALLINEGNDPVSGIFDGMPEGFRFSAAGSSVAMILSYTANLDGGSIGNDIVLTAVPEPGAALLLAVGLVVGLGFGRRRRP